MITAWVRVLTGFALACLMAGLVQVLFIMTPAQMMQLGAEAFRERAAQAAVLSLLAATHAAIFSVAFLLIAAGIGEWMRVRAPAYYIATGAIIAALGFTAQYASEVAGQPTIFNTYAIFAFIVSGVLAGLVYWLTAGRYAGRPEKAASAIGNETVASSDAAPEPRTWKNRPRIVIEDPIAPGSVANKKATLSERIAERDEKRAVEAAREAAAAPLQRPPVKTFETEVRAHAKTDDEDGPAQPDPGEIVVQPPQKA